MHQKNIPSSSTLIGLRIPVESVCCWIAARSAAAAAALLPPTAYTTRPPKFANNPENNRLNPIGIRDRKFQIRNHTKQCSLAC